MLCLYTLLQSSVSDIPKTAYLKYIDYWNILSLAITVINFFILIVWQMSHDNEKPKNTRIRSRIPQIEPNNTGIERHMKIVLRVFMPILTFVSVGIYVVTGTKIYYDY